MQNVRQAEFSHLGHKCISEINTQNIYARYRISVHYEYEPRILDRCIPPPRGRKLCSFYEFVKNNFCQLDGRRET